MAAISSSSTIDESSSSLSGGPKAFSFFGSSAQLAAVKLDRTNYLLWQVVVMPLIKGNYLEEHDDGSGNFFNRRDASSQNGEHCVITSFISAVAQGQGNKAQWRALTASISTGNSVSETHDFETPAHGSSLIEEELDHSDGLSPDATGPTSISNSPSEAPQIPHKPTPPRHHMVTRARDGISKPKYPFIGSLQHENLFDSSSSTFEPASVSEALSIPR
ncbi:uncharacterized protein G2W53_001158 [Senna tora]|uniref:Retrotransposon Copia-like N-terminal domain-containing protein n=1 Tax=Senna tora TaxID=362788 RepID=A0A834XFC8_9FABA|nr:uncharacterized protein G2W53_001158 [Senna tora]